jgi:hypothetical protein
LKSEEGNTSNPALEILASCFARAAREATCSARENSSQWIVTAPMDKVVKGKNLETP